MNMINITIAALFILLIFIKNTIASETTQDKLEEKGLNSNIYIACTPEIEILLQKEYNFTQNVNNFSISGSECTEKNNTSFNFFIVSTNDHKSCNISSIFINLLACPYSNFNVTINSANTQY